MDKINYDKIINDFIENNWGTVDGESVYRRRIEINDNNKKSIKQLYDDMVINKIIKGAC